MADRNPRHPTPVHLVGEFPISRQAAIFEMCNAALGDRLLFVPEGHIAVSFQEDVLSERAAASFEVFQHMKRNGALPARARMSVAMWMRISQLSNHAAFSSDAMVADVSKFFSKLGGSHHELGMQINIPFADLADLPVGAQRDAAAGNLKEAVVRVVDAVPAEASAILHFNCRDGASFKIESSHIAAMASLFNSILKSVSRQ